MTSFSQAVAEAEERQQRHPVSAPALEEEEGAGANNAGDDDDDGSTRSPPPPLRPAGSVVTSGDDHWGAAASMLLENDAPLSAAASSAVAAASAALTSRPSVVTTGMPGLGEPLPSGHVDISSSSSDDDDDGESASPREGGGGGGKAALVASAAATPFAAAANEAFAVDRSSSSAPFELTFAANAAVDQPTRRFRPPDQSLCVGNGVVITGNNLVLRTWDAETGAPLQGPIAQPDFFGLDGNFSDPVCIYDSQDSKRFFVGVFRFGEGATKYSQFVLAASKTSNPADGFLGPYVFRNDGLDREGKPLPGLDDCGGDEGDEAANKRGVSTEKKGSDGKKAAAAAAAAKKKNAADDDAGDKDDDIDDKSDRTEAAAAAPKKNSNRKKISPGCLGDYPAVGLDTNAFVATFNLFQTEPEEKYAGVLLLAIDKKGLLSGGASQPAFVAYSNFNAEISYTVVRNVFFLLPCSITLFQKERERKDFHL